MSGDFVHWRNLDTKRARKDTGLIIDVGRRVNPVVTPDEPDDVLAALAHDGISVPVGGM